ncbi:MAG: fibrobacter succinogenes major paralogous domain-containing protein [Bacteroidetes bacterium]|nr:fibrobacter succinogenes major paralogous domain-containing protein [Bacteroidales bacterium]MBU1009602.1 fibrobacter succinogenes major paralogous domain-containing protein [Bacteroidota bacterium]
MKTKTGFLMFLIPLTGMILLLNSGCKKSSDSNPTPGTVTDADGNVYHTITIGTQVWLAEDLKTTKFRDGSAIVNETDATAWSALSTAAYCDYDNSAANGATYGHLYNWYAVHDSRNICPSGWHVPTDADWATLTGFLGGESVAGGKLKETGTAHWLSPNTGATDEVGFKALPAGERRATGQYIYLGEYACWWSSTEYDVQQAWIRYIGNDDVDVTNQLYNKNYGYSVRCVKD